MALAHAGLSESDWARERGLTPSHVRQVAAGDRESATLQPQILAFILAREEMLTRDLQVISLDERLRSLSLFKGSAAA